MSSSTASAPSNGPQYKTNSDLILDYIRARRERLLQEADDALGLPGDPKDNIRLRAVCLGQANLLTSILAGLGVEDPRQGL